mmetsp:Transcript_34773/g.46129  ORF Transcript_34773/g.46129 Transcript_34773/m.46129 type:complete len:220 (+) Transcript_34773:515-1174(+)
MELKWIPSLSRETISIAIASIVLVLSFADKDIGLLVWLTVLASVANNSSAIMSIVVLRTTGLGLSTNPSLKAWWTASIVLVRCISGFFIRRKSSEKVELLRGVSLSLLLPKSEPSLSISSSVPLSNTAGVRGSIPIDCLSAREAKLWSRLSTARLIPFILVSVVSFWFDVFLFIAFGFGSEDIRCRSCGNADGCGTLPPDSFRMRLGLFTSRRKVFPML